MERILIILCLLSVTVSSWARDPISDEEVAAIIKEFQYESRYTEKESYKDGGAFSSCWIYEKTLETEYPQMNEPLNVYMKMYIPNRSRLGEDKVPAVIMVPPVGGINFLDRQMGETFCANNIAAVILTNDFANLDAQASGELLPPDDHQMSFYRVGAAVKATKAMIRDDLNMNEEKVGVFGVSLGGILSAFVMSTQPDLSAGYFVVAGGDIPNILAFSEQDKITSIRRKRMKEENLQSKEEYEAFLRQHMTMDPVDMARTMVPETLRMVVATRDDVVPTFNQEMLHFAYGEPKADFLPAGHLDAVLDSLLFGGDRKRVARFFKERFAEDNPRPKEFEFMEAFSLENYY